MTISIEIKHNQRPTRFILNMFTDYNYIVLKKQGPQFHRSSVL